MKKKLNEIGIVNELSGNSAFFQPSAIPAVEEVTEPKPRKRTPSPRKAVAENIVITPETGADEPSLPAQPTLSTLEKTEPIKVEAIPTPPQAQEIEAIRKAVKRLGKEASFCRFTQEEKNVLSDIIYTYKRNGIRTSENEVVRIAINWLIKNYHNDGQNSVLAQVLDRLNE